MLKFQLQVRGTEVYWEADADLQHQVRHPPVGTGHRLEPPRDLDVQVVLPQVHPDKSQNKFK